MKKYLILLALLASCKHAAPKQEVVAIPPPVLTCEDACYNILNHCDVDPAGLQDCVRSCKEADPKADQLACVTNAMTCEVIQSCFR